MSVVHLVVETVEVVVAEEEIVVVKVAAVVNGRVAVLRHLVANPPINRNSHSSLAVVEESGLVDKPLHPNRRTNRVVVVVEAATRMLNLPWTLSRLSRLIIVGSPRKMPIPLLLLRRV